MASANENPLVVMMREKREAEELAAAAAGKGSRARLLRGADYVKHMVKLMGKPSEEVRPRSAVYGGGVPEERARGRGVEQVPRPPGSAGATPRDTLSPAKRAAWMVPSHVPELRGVSRVVVSGNPRVVATRGRPGLQVRNQPSQPIARGEAAAPARAQDEGTGGQGTGDEEARDEGVGAGGMDPGGSDARGTDVGAPLPGSPRVTPRRAISAGEVGTHSRTSDPSRWPLCKLSEGAGDGRGEDRSSRSVSSAASDKSLHGVLLPAGHPQRAKSARLLHRMELQRAQQEHVRAMQLKRKEHAQVAALRREAERKEERKLAIKYAQRAQRRREREDEVHVLGARKWMEESQDRVNVYKRNVAKGRVAGPSQKHMDEMRVLTTERLPMALKSLAEAPRVSELQLSEFRLTAPPPVELIRLMTPMNLSSQSSVRNVPDLINAAKGSPHSPYASPRRKLQAAQHFLHH